MSIATALILARLHRSARQNLRRASPPRPLATHTIRPLSKSSTSV